MAAKCVCHTKVAASGIGEDRQLPDRGMIGILTFLSFADTLFLLLTLINQYC
jgi:hypothetical protein